MRFLGFSKILFWNVPVKNGLLVVSPGHGHLPHRPLLRPSNGCAEGWWSRGRTYTCAYSPHICSVAVQMHSFIMHFFIAAVARQPVQLRHYMEDLERGAAHSVFGCGQRCCANKGISCRKFQQHQRKSTLWPQEKLRRATKIEVLIIFCQGMVCCPRNNCISYRKVLTNVPFSIFHLNTYSILSTYFSVYIDLS